MNSSLNMWSAIHHYLLNQYFFLSKILKYWSYVNFLFICNYCSPTSLSERTSSFFQQNIYTTKNTKKTITFWVFIWFLGNLCKLRHSFGISFRSKLTLRIDKSHSSLMIKACSFSRRFMMREPDDEWSLRCPVCVLST